MTIEMMTITVATSGGGQMMRIEVVGTAEGTTRKTDTIGEATMTTVDAQILQHIPDLHHRPVAEDRLLRTATEEVGRPLPTIPAAPDHHLASKQMGTISTTARAFPLIALRLAATPLPQTNKPKKNPEIRLWTRLLD